MTTKSKNDLDSTLKFVEALKHQWMMTVDSLVDPLMIVDADYNIRKANQSLLKQAHLDDFKAAIGRTCYSVFFGRKSPCPGCQMTKAANNLVVQDYKIHDRGDDRGREEKIYEVRSQPLVDEAGKLGGIVQTYRDVTDKERMQRQLTQAEKMAGIGLLAGGVAHELNNPLAGVLVFAQMLLKDLPSDSPHLEDVKEIEHAAKRCKEIVDNLLAFARQAPLDHKRNAKNERMNVIACVREALKFARMGTKNQRLIEVHDLLGEEESIVISDRNNMIHVFLNLIQNAFQAMPKGGELWLELRHEVRNAQPMVVVVLRDAGGGIPEGNLQKIFDPFFTTKEPGEGTGLGLAICYGIVKELGGFIQVSSVVDEGTTMEVWLKEELKP